MVFGYYFYKSVITHLEERTSYPEKIEELLGSVVSAKRPKATSDTTSHDYTISIFHSRVVFLMLILLLK